MQETLRNGLDPWVGKIPWRRKRQPTPVFLPGGSHGQRTLAGCSPWVAKSRTRPKRLSAPQESWYGLRAGVCPGCAGGDGLDGPTPFWWCWVQRHCSWHPVFAPSSSEVAVGFLVFFCLIHNFPSGACMKLFSVLHSLFVFCCLRRHLSRCKCKHSGRVSPVPVFLSRRFLKCWCLVSCSEFWLHRCVQFAKILQAIHFLYLYFYVLYYISIQCFLLWEKVQFSITIAKNIRDAKK